MVKFKSTKEVKKLVSLHNIKQGLLKIAQQAKTIALAISNICVRNHPIIKIIQPIIRKREKKKKKVRGKKFRIKDKNAIMCRKSRESA